MKPLLPLALLAAPLASCHIHIDGGSHWTSDGVALRKEHVETLEILRWDDRGLTLDISAGDVRVQNTEGPCEIEATLHEVTHGDAHLEYQDGSLTWVTASGEPAALGDVTVRTSTPLSNLTVSTGAGDVSVDGVRITQRLSLTTGAGDLRVRGAGDLAGGSFSTGAGDIDLIGMTSPRIEASSGVGDVTLRAVRAETASLSTGAGDVSTIDSDFHDLDASTGVGDIDAATAHYERADLDTGFGDIDRSDG